MAENRKGNADSSQPSLKKLRMFVAIELPEAVLEALARLQVGVREYGFAASWTRPGNIHLTLKFLGDVTATEIIALGERIGSVARQTPPISLVAQGVGVFPSARRARVLWSGVGGETGRLGLLQQSLESSFETLGYERERKRFTGHLTLARFKGHVDPEAVISVMRQFGDFVSVPFTADQVHLFESRLTPRGSVYTKRVSHRLGGSLTD